jgi:hypothetical protein
MAAHDQSTWQEPVLARDFQCAPRVGAQSHVSVLGKADYRRLSRVEFLLCWSIT